jgi:hypothetical protein
MPPDVHYRGTSESGVIEVVDRRCTPGCLANCARTALRAGPEGSGLALPIAGTELRCRFHHELVARRRFRALHRTVSFVLLRIRIARAASSRGVAFVRRSGEAATERARSWANRIVARGRASVIPDNHAVDRTRQAAVSGFSAAGSLIAETPMKGHAATRERASRDARRFGDAPRCTARCLMQCARAGLSAGVEGSGLGLTVEGRCRFHRSLLEPEHSWPRRTIAAVLRGLRAQRPWIGLQVRRLRAIPVRIGNARRRLEDGARAGRQQQTLLVVLVRTVVARTAAGGARRARALRARTALRGRALWARVQPRAWWAAFKYRARRSGELRIRQAAAAITEFVIWAVPRPRPPVRSVVHVSLISHKQYMLSRLARNHGLKGTFLAINTYPDAHLKIGFDYEVPMNMDPFRRFLRASWYLWTVLAFHDVIHYHFNGFLFDDGTDLRVLQRMGKVVIAHYRGCDLRCRSINMAKNPVLNVCQECSYPVGSCDTDYQRGKIAISRAYSDIRFVTTPDLLDFTDDAEHLPFIAPYAIDFSAIQPAPRKPGVFRVVTSSNHPALDGVRFVRDAVDRLAAEGVSIELIEIFRQPFYEALSLYKSADLYCGKLRMGYYNNANIESLMLGVPNMCYIRDEFLDRIPDSPIIVARPDDVYQKLREWVAKPEELQRLGAQGPEFVRRHHQSDQLMVRMIGRYNEALQRKLAARYEAAQQSSVLH